MKKYLQRAWSDSEDDISIKDVRIAIAETKEMDDEHGAFWVGTEEEEYILETDKALKMICVINGEQLNYQAKNWAEVEKLYDLLLKEDFAALINAFR
ncbi:hypothetical protein AB6735_23860 [Mucilaginibacter sp. RCC_168]|uniref:hypothetical protein n=1 Tax=Mucilaginibacter sp. RCC_168 TaxID=3239221 RepID=UPI003523DC31